MFVQRNYFLQANGQLKHFIINRAASCTSSTYHGASAFFSNSIPVTGESHCSSITKLFLFPYAALLSNWLRSLLTPFVRLSLTISTQFKSQRSYFNSRRPRTFSANQHSLGTKLFMKIRTKYCKGRKVSARKIPKKEADPCFN